MKARIHVLRWHLDRSATDSDDATALVHGQLELDGHMVQNAKLKIETEGNEVLMLTAELLVTSIEIVEHSDESWRELDLP